MTAESLDIRPLLRDCNAAIVVLKRALRRPHDESSPLAQRRLRRLAHVATVLHVHQATRRERMHGRLFESLDAQRAWLARWWRDDLQEVLAAA